MKTRLNLRTLALFALCSSGSALGLAAANPAGAVEQKLEQLTRYPAYRELARQPIAEAERALRRARDARAAGDAAHAALLEQAADEWASAGVDLVRATRAESQAARLEQQAAEAEAKLLRAQALLEETSARRSLALQKLRELRPEAPSTPTPAKPDAPKAAPGAKP